MRRGEIVALIGPNGVGKSTPLRIIDGLEPADAGVVEVSASIGFVPRHGGLDPYLRPAEHFELFGCAGGRSNRVSRAEGRRLARELGWDASSASVVAELSGGTRQKLAVVLHALLSLVALARRRLTMLILVLLPVVFSQGRRRLGRTVAPSAGVRDLLGGQHGGVLHDRRRSGGRTTAQAGGLVNAGPGAGRLTGLSIVALSLE